MLPFQSLYLLLRLVHLQPMQPTEALKQMMRFSQVHVVAGSHSITHSRQIMHPAIVWPAVNKSHGLKATARQESLASAN